METIMLEEDSVTFSKRFKIFQKHLEIAFAKASMKANILGVAFTAWRILYRKAIKQNVLVRNFITEWGKLSELWCSSILHCRTVSRILPVFGQGFKLYISQLA